MLLFCSRIQFSSSLATSNGEPETEGEEEVEILEHSEKEASPQISIDQSQEHIRKSIQFYELIYQANQRL